LTCKRYADPSTDELSTLRASPRNDAFKTQLVSCLGFVAHCATILVGCPEPRPSRSVKTPSGQLAELPRRLFRHAPQQADADHAEECRQLDAWLGLPDAAYGHDQGLAAAGGRSSVLHHPRQRMGGGCPLRPYALALYISTEQGRAHRPAGRWHLQ